MAVRTVDFTIRIRSVTAHTGDALLRDVALRAALSLGPRNIWVHESARGHLDSVRSDVD